MSRTRSMKCTILARHISDSRSSSANDLSWRASHSIAHWDCSSLVVEIGSSFGVYGIIVKLLYESNNVISRIWHEPDLSGYIEIYPYSYLFKIHTVVLLETSGIDGTATYNENELNEMWSNILYRTSTADGREHCAHPHIKEIKEFCL